MFLPARILMILLITVFGTMIVFSRFHHVFFLAAAEAHRDMNAAGRLPPDPRNDYKVGIAASGPPAAGLPLPGLSRLTTEGITVLAPAFKAGKVAIAPMQKYIALNAFEKADGDLQRLRLTQLRTKPQAIVVAEGNYDFAHLFQAISALTPEDPAIRREADAYTLRLPLFVAPGASLTISGRDLGELRLSQERGAFIANSGALFILRTKVTGWSETHGAPSAFQTGASFRPFITALSGSQTYVAGSALSHLGYRKGESRGLAYAICHDCLKENPKLPGPAGAVVESVFTDLYSGFRSHEANDIAVVGNTYINSVACGISAQGPAHHLIIANNEIYGSRENHGILLSGNVSESWIVGNNSHDNHGSGILLDRGSTRNVIANNTLGRNKGDGLGFRESSGNWTQGNTIFRNGLSGARVRNSVNISLRGDYIMDNAMSPLIVYTKPGKAEASPRAAATVADAIIRPTGHRAAVKLDGADRLTVSDASILSGNRAFSDDIPADDPKLNAALGSAREQVIVVPAASKSAAAH